MTTVTCGVRAETAVDCSRGRFTERKSGEGSVYF